MDSQLRQQRAAAPRRRRLQIALILAVVVGYIASEWGLRHVVYGRPKVQSIAELQPLLEKMPTLMRTWIEPIVKRAELESRIGAAKGEPQLALLMQLAAQLGPGRKQRDTYLRVRTSFRTSPNAAPAWAALIQEYPEVVNQPVASFLTYARGVKPQNAKTMALVWTAGWSAFMRRPPTEQLAFLTAMAESRPTDAGLVDAYETLVSLATWRDQPELARQAQTLLDECLALQDKLRP